MAWLGGLVGAEVSDEAGAPDGRPSGPWSPARCRAYRARGTADGLRDLVAAAAGVPAEQVSVAESGAVTWSCTPGGAVPPPFDPVVTITVTVLPGRDQDAVAACARAAAEPAASRIQQLQIEVVEQ